jgi:hypothetical protein
MLQPVTTHILYYLAYTILSFFIILRLFLKKRTTSSLFRAAIMLVLMLIASVDMMSSSMDGTFENFMTVFINVTLLLFFIRSLREVWVQIFKVMMSSAALFMIIFAYIIFFSFVGYVLFANNQEDSSFGDLFSSVYTVFILFTVSNYPNISIPFYEVNREAAIYFWVYLCIAVFLLTNLLLAVIFNNYQNILHKKINKNQNKVAQFFIDLFDTLVKAEDFAQNRVRDADEFPYISQ